MKKEKDKQTAPANAVAAEVKKKGRPANANSARQVKLAKQDEAKKLGTFRKGRPLVASSKRQQVLVEREAKRVQGIEVKRGRPAQIKVVEEKAQ